ncbi:MAG: DUF58 domain-containing protein [Anaerolineales bacterium]|nr:DUF58 domain-containing protein [Anaerolineales bacterium]
MLRFLPFLLLLFIIAAFLRIDFFFTIAYLFFGVWLLAQLWSQRNMRGLRLTRHFVNRAFNGDEVEMQVRAHNTGRLPLTWVHVQDSVPVDLGVPKRQARVFSLNAQESGTLNYTLHCRKRGVYRLGPLMARTGDLFGLLETRPFESQTELMIVYPRVVPLAKLGLPTRSPLAALPDRTPLFEDTARVIGVREYAPGDSLRRIHWTATASAGQLLVKNYQPAIARETLIALDLDPENYELRGRHDLIELAITVAASIANYTLGRERQPVGLVVQARDGAAHSSAATEAETALQFNLPPRAERAQLMTILETLARVQPLAGRPFAEFLRQQSLHLAWGTTLVVIAGRADVSLFSTLAQLRQAGFPVAVIVVQGSLLREARQRAAVLRIPIYAVGREKDLETLSS